MPLKVWSTGAERSGHLPPAPMPSLASQGTPGLEDVGLEEYLHGCSFGGLQVHTQSSPSLAVPVEKRLELLNQALLLPVCPPSIDESRNFPAHSALSRPHSLRSEAQGCQAVRDVAHGLFQQGLTLAVAACPITGPSKAKFNGIPPFPPSPGRVKRCPRHAVESFRLACRAWQDMAGCSLAIVST